MMHNVAGRTAFSGLKPAGFLPKSYRPDIDGLRALAVVPVVLFHLGSTIFKGGFIGVDVFFVISGYLITGILQAEIVAGRFSILGFYDRRIRRIFPALFAMILASACAGLLLLLPPELVDFGQSAIATTLFASNMYFMATTDYFNIASDSYPLLHTWSLAVEEQFYIFFPVLLFGLNRLDRRYLHPAIVVLAAISLAFSIYLVRVNQIEAFYVAPSRIWELLIGSIVALGVVPQLPKAWMREGLAALGMALILAGCLVFYRNMPFPGLRALVPCLGAAFLIHSGMHERTLVGRLLSLQPIVFLGLISYSWYLWHWPIIVFTKLWWVTPIGGLGRAGLFVASAAIATLSWRFIERPFRLKTLARKPATLRGFGFACMAICLVLGVVLIQTSGLERLFPPEVARLASFIKYNDRPFYRRGVCFLDSHADPLSNFSPEVCLNVSHDKPNLLVIGDSHAAHLWSGLSEAAPSIQVLQMTAAGCKPVLGSSGHPTCLALMRQALEETAPKMDAVLLSARWEPEDIAPLLKTVDQLSQRVKRVYVSGPIVEYYESLPRLLAVGQESGDARLLVSARLDAQRSVDEALGKALEGHQAIYLSPYHALCGALSEPCRTTTEDGAPLQWDYGHLTAEGSKYLAAEWQKAGVFNFAPAPIKTTESTANAQGKK